MDWKKYNIKISKFIWNEKFVGNVQSTSKNETKFFVSGCKSMDSISSVVVLFILIGVMIGDQVKKSNNALTEEISNFIKNVSQLTGARFFLPINLSMNIKIIVIGLLFISLIKPRKFYKTRVTWIFVKITLFVSSSVLMLSQFGVNIPVEIRDSVVMFLVFQLFFKIPYKFFCSQINSTNDSRSLIINEKIASYILFTAPCVFLLVETMIFVSEKIMNYSAGGSGLVRIIVDFMTITIIMYFVNVQNQFVKRSINAFVYLGGITFCLSVILSFFDNIDVTAQFLDFVILGMSIGLIAVIIGCLEYRQLIIKKKEYVNFYKARNINPYLFAFTGMITVVGTVTCFVLFDETYAMSLLGLYIALLFLIIRENEDNLIKFFTLVTVSLVLILLKKYMLEFLKINWKNATAIMFVIEILCFCNMLLTVKFVNIHLNGEYSEKIFNKEYLNGEGNDYLIEEKIRIVNLIEQKKIKEVTEKYGLLYETCKKIEREYWNQYYYNIFKYQLIKLHYSDKKIRELFSEFTELRIAKCIYVKRNRDLFLKVKEYYHITNPSKKNFLKTKDVEAFVKRILSTENNDLTFKLNEKKLFKEFIKLKEEMELKKIEISF